MTTYFANTILGAVGARGWNHEKIRWLTLDQGKKKCERTGQPAMIVVHRSNCNMCRQLKQKFINSSHIQELSKEFVMINVEDESEDSLEQLNIDGGYAPRILFMDHQGNILKQIKNSTSENGKYFHSEAASLYHLMKVALNVTNTKRIILKTKSPVPVMSRHT